MSHLLVFEQAGYRHTQAPPPLWERTAQLRPGNGCHGDGCPGVQLGEGQHWPLPLQLSGSYPGVSHCLLGGPGTDIKGPEMYTEDKFDWICVGVCVVVYHSPAPCFPGLYPKPCIPDLWEVAEPIPGQKDTGDLLYSRLSVYKIQRTLCT